MTTFNYTLLVEEAEDHIATALGTTSPVWTDKEIGKAVKMSTASNFIQCAGGNDIEGIVTSVEPSTVNSGYAFGSIKNEGRVMAVVGANQGATPMAVLDYVVADTQVAVGTAGVAAVKTGSPAKFFWRCIRIVSGTGVAGDSILIERVG